MVSQVVSEEAPLLLKRVRVTNFRSVDDSEEFTIDQVTCLVGKNEAGKSAILLAMAALNPHASTPATLNKERDYPRRFLTQYEERGGVSKSCWREGVAVVRAAA